MAMKGFQQILKGLAKEVSSLDVITLTGKINVDFNAAGDTYGKGLAEEIITKIKSSGGDDNKVEVVAFTRYEWDLDVVMFLKEGLSEKKDSEILKLHKDTMQISHDVRKSLIQLIADVFGDIIDPLKA
jgi:hypothetical protein